MRIVAHLDMDAFFASIEEADSEIFRGKPIVVGSDPKEGKGRGVVSTANYKAREYGIRSALPISRAWQLSQKAKAEGKPEAVFVQPDFERYVRASKDVFEIIKKHVPPQQDPDKGGTVEPASIDEFYFSAQGARLPDGQGPASGWDYAVRLCKKIKKEIKNKLGVTCSIGLGPNKLIAKIAAGIKKPDGLFVVKDNPPFNGAEKFLEPLPIREIPGIGPKTEALLNEKGVKIVKDLKKFSKKELEDLLGKYGIDLYYKARGIDDSLIVENRVVKSIGEQATFEQNTLNAVYIGESLERMCKSVFLRFKASGFETFKTIGIVVRFSDFQTQTTAKTLKKPTNNEKEFKLEALKLLLPYLDRRKNPRKKLIRLIGVKVERFNI